MTNESGVSCQRWSDVPVEAVTPMFERQLITGKRVMLARVALKKDCQIPKHQHEHEQLTYVVDGALRFWIGESERETLEVSAGSVVHFPSNVPHKAVVLADSLVIDVFSPPRQDWLDKSDEYLRQPGG